MINAGEKAPDFTLISDDGKNISLSDFKGKSDVVLYFYPKDNTSGCTKEACSFRDNIKQIRKKSTVVLGVSPDSQQSHQKFIQKYDLNFNLLSDPDHKVAEAYGAWGKKKMYGREYFGILRTTVIIEKNGKIKKVFEKVKAADHAIEILETL